MTEFLEAYSYAAIVVTLILTGCGLPIPEEVPIIAAGVAVSLGKLDVTLAFLACLVGALLGDAAMYWLGRMFGRGLMSRGWFSHWLNEDTEAQAEVMIRKHGVKVFFGARFLVGVRAPMYITAGILRVPFSRFLAIDAICAGVVVSVVFGLSCIYGRHFQAMWEWIHGSQLGLTAIVLVVVGAVAGILLWRRHRARKAEREEHVHVASPSPPRERAAVEKTEAVS